MKAIAVMFLLAGWLQTSPDGPALTPNADYPLHVQVILTKASGNHYGYDGFGRGNLLGPPLKGIDFTYDCGAAILNNQPAEFYQARWKKTDRQLEILLQRVGSDHLDKCELDIAYKPAPYTVKPRTSK